MKSKISDIKALIKEVYLSDDIKQKIVDAEARFVDVKREFDVAKERWQRVEEELDPIRNKYFEIGGQYDQWPWNEKLEEKWRAIQKEWEENLVHVWTDEHEKFDEVRVRYNQFVNYLNNLRKGIDTSAKRGPLSPEEEETWRMYGGDPSKHPWGLGS
jgi:predicted  nucleic acid-binding Zn-ribbon protein